MELLRCYSIPDNNIHLHLDEERYNPWFDNTLQYCIPYNMRISITNTVLDVVGFTDDITFSASESSDNFKCYHSTKSPTTVGWTESYALDKSTQII